MKRARWFVLVVTALLLVVMAASESVLFRSGGRGRLTQGVGLSSHDEQAIQRPAVSQTELANQFGRNESLPQLFA